MFKFITLATLALSAVSSVSAAAIPRDENSYDKPVLEPYQQYNDRYNKLGCAEQHDTQFFDDCCHPMKIGETLDKNRKAYCNPANASASAAPAPASTTSSAAAPTESPEDPEDDEDCEDEDESSTAPAPTSVVASTAAPKTTAAPATTAAPVNAAPPPPSEKPSSSAAPSSEEKPSATPTPTTSKAAAPSPTPTKSSGESGSGQTFSGTATWFTQNGVAGACGKVHPDSDLLVAMDYRMYGDLSKQSQYCGRNVRITNKSNGKSITALVADACPTCESSGSLDLSKGAFGALTDSNFGLGVFPIEWQLV